MLAGLPLTMLLRRLPPHCCRAIFSNVWTQTFCDVFLVVFFFFSSSFFLFFYSFVSKRNVFICSAVKSCASVPSVTLSLFLSRSYTRKHTRRHAQRTHYQSMLLLFFVLRVSFLNSSRRTRRRSCDVCGFCELSFPQIKLLTFDCGTVEENQLTMQWQMQCIDTHDWRLKFNGTLCLLLLSVGLS